MKIDSEFQYFHPTHISFTLFFRFSRNSILDSYNPGSRHTSHHSLHINCRWSIYLLVSIFLITQINVLHRKVQSSSSQHAKSGHHVQMVGYKPGSSDGLRAKMEKRLPADKIAQATASSKFYGWNLCI